jgi:catechol 2,3-dioxygenase-like lactoylglutathione lyase family enzyme
MVRFNGINHLAMATADMDATVRFYHGVLGARLVATIGTSGFRHYFFEVGEANTVAFFESAGLYFFRFYDFRPNYLVFEHGADSLRRIEAAERSRFGDRFSNVRLPLLTDVLALLESRPDVTLFVEIKRESLTQFGHDQVVAWEAHVGGFLAGLLLFSVFDPVPQQAQPA